MTEHRDPDIARRLAELNTPEHGPDFWATVRAASSSPQPSAGDAHFVENDEPVALLADRRRAAVPRIWLAAAALVVLALVAGGLLIDREAGETDVTTEPTPPTDPGDVDPAPAGPLRPVGEPIERGSGRVVAVDPTGRFLYVADDASEGGFGCEGTPRQALFVEPIDGGERRQVLPVDRADATGGIEVRFGTEGVVAVVSRCEGYGSTVVTGTVADDGTVVDAVELVLPDADGVLDLEFRSRGVLVASTYVGAEGTNRRHLYEFPVTASEPTDLGLTDVIHLDATADGRLATSSVDGAIRFDGEVVAEVDEVRELAVSDSGRQLIVETGWRPAGMLLVDTATGEQTLLEEPTQFDSGTMVFPAEGIILYSLGESASSYIHSVVFDPEPGEPTLLAPSQAWTDFVVTGDLTRLFFTGHGPDGAPTVYEQPLAR